MPGGRPTIYTQEIADEICERLAGGESLRKICNGPVRYDDLIDEDRHSHLPNISTVLRWAINVDHEFCPQYEQARAAQMEGYTDRLEEIAENVPEVARARLMSDNMKWAASRLLSRRYGDRIKAEVTDPGGDALGTGAASQLANIIATALTKKNNDDDENIA